MKYLIGIDVGGTKIRGILIDLKGVVLKKKEICIVDKQKEDLISLVKIIEELDSKKVIGIGVGVPGLLDLKREKIIKLPNLAGWEEFKLKDFLSKRFKKKISIENDGNCIALGEKNLGNGKGHNNFISLNIGTGLGGGIIIDGKMYKGMGNAGEFGHMKIGGNLLCGCGQKGCFETLVSGEAIERIARRRGLKGNPKEIFFMAKKGNKKARNVFLEVGKNLGNGICNLIFLIDPEIILVGGGVSEVGELLLKPAREYVSSQIGRKVKIKRVKLGKDSGAIGAATLLM